MGGSAWVKGGVTGPSYTVRVQPPKSRGALARGRPIYSDDWRAPKPVRYVTPHSLNEYPNAERARGPQPPLRKDGLLRRRWLFIPVGLAVVGLAIAFPAWRKSSDQGGQKPAEPFRIAGNLWYVGANDIASFLVTGPEGHVLIDGGYPGSAPMIVESIAKLGFDIRDVEVLLNSEPHFDHAGGLAELQRASGAELWASGPSAETMAAGGNDRDIFLPLRTLFWIGLLGYDAPRIDHVFEDGDTIRVGPVEVIAHVTGGHTRGCTSYSIPVREGDRELLAVSACSLIVLGGTRYPEQPADLQRTFEVLRSLPADVWVTSHARLWGRYRKFVARDTAASPIEPFIDPEGYRTYIDSGEARFRRGVVQ